MKTWKVKVFLKVCYVTSKRVLLGTLKGYFGNI